MCLDVYVCMSIVWGDVCVGVTHRELSNEVHTDEPSMGPSHHHHPPPIHPTSFHHCLHSILGEKW